MLRVMLDRVHPLFAHGGRLERMYPLYEALDTFLYTPSDTVHGHTHVRDFMDLKRIMSLVVAALIPCILLGCWNTGYQANHAAATAKAVYDEAQAERPEDERQTFRVDSLTFGTWQADLIGRMGLGFDPNNPLACFVHGLLFFLPIYIVTMAAGGTCELIFAIIRRHDINEGFLVTSMLYALILPAETPLWQVALGIIFGVVIGKEVFGGTGKNFLNPALTSRAYLYFAHPQTQIGTEVWVPLDGYSGATILGGTSTYSKLAENDEGKVVEVTDQILGANYTNFNGIDFARTLSDGTEVVATWNEGYSWWDAFMGWIPGSLGETSALAALIGAIILIATGVGSWRIMLGMVLGGVGMSGLFWSISQINLIGEFGWKLYPMMYVAPWWHLVIGSFAFGTVFMATDPVSAAQTNTGRWIFGALCGVATVIVRVLNAGFAEGVMLGILFGNVCAPLIDYYVMQANISRRLARART